MAYLEAVETPLLTLEVADSSEAVVLLLTMEEVVSLEAGVETQEQIPVDYLEEAEPLQIQILEGSLEWEVTTSQLRTQEGYLVPPANLPKIQEDSLVHPASQPKTQEGYSEPPANLPKTQEGYSEPSHSQHRTLVAYSASQLLQLKTQAASLALPHSQIRIQEDSLVPNHRQIRIQEDSLDHSLSQIPVVDSSETLTTNSQPRILGGYSASLTKTKLRTQVAFLETQTKIKITEAVEVSLAIHNRSLPNQAVFLAIPTRTTTQTQVAYSETRTTPISNSQPRTAAVDYLESDLPLTSKLPSSSSR